MIGEALTHPNSRVLRLDPRARLVLTLLFTVVVVLSEHRPALWTALALAVLVGVLARLRLRPALWRLGEVNFFIFMIWLVLPFSVRGEAVGSLGPLTATREGIALALALTLKCNAVLLAGMALVATMDSVQLGHALTHLRLPPKLIRVFLLAVRYFDVFHREYHRLRTAMKVRGFRLRTSRHTYRSIAYLVGMLLVRSLDRSERIYAAMKCRGYRGEFYLVDHFHWHAADNVFVAFGLILLLGLGCLEWLPLMS